MTRTAALGPGTAAAPGRWVVQLNGAHELSREHVGGKAWSVNRLRALTIPTPPAVALTIDTCRLYQDTGELPDRVWNELIQEMSALETDTQCRFGATQRPLLVSVRSGSALSMPGMMDTVLNLGWNDAVQAALAHDSGDPAFAADTRRRFETEFRRTVLGTPEGVIPVEPLEQLRMAVLAVFGSWNSERAKTYRRHHGLSEQGGTAVTVQAMVFGNMDANSGTGVLFSRNPLTGEPRPFGEWLRQAQGEDIVSGRFTPQPLERMRDILPGPHDQLLEAARRLELDGRDMQDIEFTVQSGRLWILQTRAAKRSPRAAVRLAVDFCEEGMIDVKQALSRVTPDHVRALLAPQLDMSDLAKATLLASGEPACPGFAAGRVVTDADIAADRGDQEALVLVRSATSPEDIHGMIAARGIVTATGGATSHAAVISREIGVPCVVGCGHGVLALQGRIVTVDGATGKVYDGRLNVIAADNSDAQLVKLAEWASAGQGEVAEMLATMTLNPT
jgi:pyruvate,orthophosphate dikinase